MISRRKFLKFLAAVLPAAFLPIEPMGKVAAEPTGENELIHYHDRIIIDQRRVDRYTHMMDAYQYYQGSQWSEAQMAQMKLNRHRSKCLEIISRKL